MIANLFLGRDAFLDFIVSVTGMALIIPALFWLFFGERECTVRTKENGEQQPANQTARILFWLIIITLGILIAPVSSSFIQTLIGPCPYIDTMIAIPTVLVVIYSFIHLMNRLCIIGRKRLIAFICLVIMIVTANSVFITYDHPLGIELTTNPKKISPEIQELCRLVGSSYVLVPDEIYGQIGEYDSGVKAGHLNGIPFEKYYAYGAAKVAADAKTPLYIIRKSYDIPYASETFGYKKTAETKHYVIYQRSEE